MSATSASRSVAASAFAPAWLPPAGRGNGLCASAWAPVADLPTGLAGTLLDILAEARIPAYVAAAPRPLRPVEPRAWRPGSTVRLWVASQAYGHAEDVLMTCLPGLLSPQERPGFPVPVRRRRHRRR